MPVDYVEVLKEIEAEEGRLLTELNTLRAAKPAILRFLNSQQSVLDAPTPVTIRGRFAGVGATKAIPIYLGEKRMALTSRQIMDGLKAEGWTSESEDHLATVSATLSQLREKGTVRKIGDGWMIAGIVMNPEEVTISEPAQTSLAATLSTRHSSVSPQHS